MLNADQALVLLEAVNTQFVEMTKSKPPGALGTLRKIEFDNNLNALRENKNNQEALLNIFKLSFNWTATRGSRLRDLILKAARQIFCIELPTPKVSWEEANKKAEQAKRLMPIASSLFTSLGKPTRYVDRVYEEDYTQYNQQTLKLEEKIREEIDKFELKLHPAASSKRWFNF